MPADRRAGIVPGVFAGRVITAGGREVRVVEQDGPDPPVLLIGGCGVPYYLWDLVVDRLADRRLVRMDRPGLTGTPWPGRLPTLAEEVDTLADLVSRLGGTAVVAAHSMAGLHAEGLARRWADRVTGLLLVDSSVQSLNLPGSAMPGWPAPRRQGRVERAPRWQGRAERVRRIMRSVPPIRSLGSFADRIITTAQSGRVGLFDHRTDLQRAVFRQPDAIASVLAEQASYDNQLVDLAELRRLTPWPGTRAHVLTATLDGGPDWVGLQAGLAAELGAEHTVVEGSRHLMMIDRPDAIVDAIRRLLP